MNCRTPAFQGFVLVLALLLAAGSSALAAPSLEELRAEVKLHPENIKAVYYLGRTYAEKGNYAQAVRLFMYLLKRPRQPGSASDVTDKMRVQLLNRIGFLYFKSGDDVRAAKVWTHSLRRYPDNEFARKGLAAIQKRKGGTPAKPADKADTTPPASVETRAEPPVSPAEAKKAYDDGLQNFNQGKVLVDQGKDDQAKPYFGEARDKLEIALRGKHEPAETNYYLGMSYLKEAVDDFSELEKARDYLMEALKLRPSDPNFTPEITFGLAIVYGFLDDKDNELLYYEKTLELKPNYAEVHYRASLAYDKAGRQDSSSKSFEHAKKAIKLDPNYKKKFQPMIRNSHVAKTVASIIHEIIQKSEDSQIPDEDAARYAERIGKILGDNNIKSEMLGEENSSSIDKLKDAIKDPTKRQQLRQFWDASAGGDPAKVQDIIDNASPGQKEQVQKILSNDKNQQKIQKYLGNTKLQEAINQQQE